MSLHALSWVLKHSEAKNGSRLVLIALADFAHDDGSQAFPSLETLTRHTRLGRTAVREGLRRLQEDGRIVETGKTRSGTSIFDLRLSDSDEAGVSDSGRRGSDSGHRGSDSGARGSDSDPDPLDNSQERSSPPKGSPPSEPSEPSEPPGLQEWLERHVKIAGEYEITASVPREGTTYRAEVARAFADIVAEGYSADDFVLASYGVLSDPFMRDGGYVKPENVLRRSKFGGRVDAGRRAVEAMQARAPSKYARFE